jgi:group I intron endonuclease
MIIYKIVNRINNKIYVGLTRKDVSQRVVEHITDKTYIGKALRRYGIESFVISVIDKADSVEVLKEKECYWIRTLDCKAPKGYNLTDGGDGLVNPSEKVRRAISDTLKKHYKTTPPTAGFAGHSHSEDSKKKVSDTLRMVFSDPKVREKMSKAQKEVPKSEDHKKKIGLSNKGKLKGRIPWNKNLSMNSIPGYVNPMTGKKRPDLAEHNKARSGEKRFYSEERNRKIGLSRLGKKYPRKNLAKKERLQNEDKIESGNSIAECSENNFKTWSS